MMKNQGTYIYILYVYNGTTMQPVMKKFSTVFFLSWRNASETDYTDGLNLTKALCHLSQLISWQVSAV